MTADCYRLPRRQFLGSAAGLAAGTAVGLAFADALNDRFELSIHQYSLKKLFEQGTIDTFSYPEFVHKQFGFTNIEFAVEFCQSLYTDPEKGAALAERSRQLGIRHRALLCGAEPALDVPDEKERRQALDEHLRWARVAEQLQCDFLRVRVSSEGNKRDQLSYAAQGVTALCEELAKSPVSVLVENITGPSRDADWLAALVERVGPNRLGVIADFGNFDGDIYAGMERLMPYAKSICTKSWEFDQQGNETKIDFRRMMQIIKASSFRGCIAIEYLGEEPVAGVQKTAELIKRSI